MMAWVYLALAIVLEVAGTTCLKLSDGLTRLWPSVLIFVFYGLAFVGLSLALKRLDLSVTYAIWAGLGTVLTAIIGFAVFGEAVTTLRMISIGLITAGVIGLQISGAH